MLKKEGMTKSRFVFLSIFSFALVLLMVWIVYAVSVSSIAPADANINTSRNINFTFNATWISPGETIGNCSLWTNISGSWVMALETDGSTGAQYTESSNISNSSAKSYINYTFTGDINGIAWSIGCYNDSTASGVRTFTSNRTLTIDTQSPNVTITSTIYDGFNTSSATPTINFVLTDLVNGTGSGINISGDGNASLNVTLYNYDEAIGTAGVALRAYNASNENLTCSPTGQAVTSTTCTLNIASFPLTNGTKNITISVTDRVGKFNITAFKFTVDNIPPYFVYYNITNSSGFENASAGVVNAHVKGYGQSDKDSVRQGTTIYLLANWTDNLTQPLRGDWQVLNASTWSTLNESNITLIYGTSGGWLNLSYTIPTGHNIFEGTNLSFRIRANDTLGNLNSTGRSITIQINDTTPPELMVTINVTGQRPVNKTNTTDTTPTIIWNITENNALRYINLSVDAYALSNGTECNLYKQYGTIDSANANRNGSFTLFGPDDVGSCTTLANGTHNVVLTVEDGWGNRGQYNHTFIIQTGEAMNIVLGMINNSVGGIQPTANQSNITSMYQLTFNVTLDGGVSTLKNVTWISDCNSSVTSFNNATAISPFVACAGVEANKTVTIQAYDHVGNSVTRMFSFIIDDVAPSVAVHSPVNGTIFNDIVYINVSALDNLGRVTGIGYFLDGNDVLTNHSSGFNLSNRAGANTTILNISVNFTGGYHTIKIRVNDTLGNERNSSVISFTQIGPIDTSLLNISLHSYISTIASVKLINVTMRIKNGSGSYLFVSGTNHSNNTYEIALALNSSMAGLRVPGLILNGTIVALTDINGSGVNWDRINFSIVTSGSTIQQGIGQNRSADVLGFVYFNDSIDEFIPLASNYIGAVTFKFNISNGTGTAQQFWWLEDETDLTSRQNISKCDVAFTKETTEPCWNYSSSEVGRTIVFVPHFSAVVVINDSGSPNVTVVKPLETQTEGTFIPNITVSSDARFCNYTINTSTSTGSETVMTLSGTTCTASAISVTNGTVGNNNITFYVWDDSSNQKVVIFNFNVSDATPPNFTSASASVASTSATITVTTNESVNATSEYGTTVALGTAGTPQTDFDTSQALSLTGLSASTIYYYNVTSCDKAFNCIENGTFNFTTSAAAAAAESSSSSSSSGGGGAAATATTTAASQTAAWNSIGAGEEVTWSISNEKIAVKGIEFSVNEGVSSASVKVSSLKSAPASVDALSKAYQYLEIKTTNVGPTNVKKGTITFDVPRSWLAENGLSESAVALFRHASGQWNELSTSVKTSTSTSVTYSAVTPGFSYFAVAAKAAPSEEAPEAAEAAPEAPKEAAKPLPIAPPGAQPSTIGWVITVAVIIIIIGIVVSRRKKK